MFSRRASPCKEFLARTVIPTIIFVFLSSCTTLTSALDHSSAGSFLRSSTSIDGTISSAAQHHQYDIDEDADLFTPGAELLLSEETSAVAAVNARTGGVPGAPEEASSIVGPSGSFRSSSGRWGGGRSISSTATGASSQFHRYRAWIDENADRLLQLVAQTGGQRLNYEQKLPGTAAAAFAQHTQDRLRRAGASTVATSFVEKSRRGVLRQNPTTQARELVLTDSGAGREEDRNFLLANEGGESSSSTHQGTNEAQAVAVDETRSSSTSPSSLTELVLTDPSGKKLDRRLWGAFAEGAVFEGARKTKKDETAEKDKEKEPRLFEDLDFTNSTRVSQYLYQPAKNLFYLWHDKTADKWRGAYLIALPLDNDDIEDDVMTMGLIEFDKTAAGDKNVKLSTKNTTDPSTGAVQATTTVHEFHASPGAAWKGHAQDLLYDMGHSVLTNVKMQFDPSTVTLHLPSYPVARATNAQRTGNRGQEVADLEIKFDKKCTTAGHARGKQAEMAHNAVKIFQHCYQAGTAYASAVTQSVVALKSNTSAQIREVLKLGPLHSLCGIYDSADQGGGAAPGGGGSYQPFLQNNVGQITTPEFVSNRFELWGADLQSDYGNATVLDYLIPDLDNTTWRDEAIARGKSTNLSDYSDWDPIWYQAKKHKATLLEVSFENPMKLDNASFPLWNEKGKGLPKVMYAPTSETLWKQGGVLVWSVPCVSTGSSQDLTASWCDQDTGKCHCVNNKTLRMTPLIGQLWSRAASGFFQLVRDVWTTEKPEVIEYTTQLRDKTSGLFDTKVLIEHQQSSVADLKTFLYKNFYLDKSAQAVADSHSQLISSGSSLLVSDSLTAKNGTVTALADYWHGWTAQTATVERKKERAWQIRKDLLYLETSFYDVKINSDYQAQGASVEFWVQNPEEVVSSGASALPTSWRLHTDLKLLGWRPKSFAPPIESKFDIDTSSGDVNDQAFLDSIATTFVLGAAKAMEGNPGLDPSQGIDIQEINIMDPVTGAKSPVVEEVPEGCFLQQDENSTNTSFSLLSTLSRPSSWVEDGATEDKKKMMMQLSGLKSLPLYLITDSGDHGDGVMTGTPPSRLQSSSLIHHQQVEQRQLLRKAGRVNVHDAATATTSSLKKNSATMGVTFVVPNSPAFAAMNASQQAAVNAQAASPNTTGSVLSSFQAVAAANPTMGVSVSPPTPPSNPPTTTTTTTTVTTTSGPTPGPAPPAGGGAPAPSPAAAPQPAHTPTPTLPHGCACSAEDLEPRIICGTDGAQYGSVCEALCANTEIHNYGVCTGPGTHRAVQSQHTGPTTYGKAAGVELSVVGKIGICAGALLLLIVAYFYVAYPETGGWIAFLRSTTPQPVTREPGSGSEGGGGDAGAADRDGDGESKQNPQVDVAVEEEDAVQQEERAATVDEAAGAEEEQQPPPQTAAPPAAPPAPLPAEQSTGPQGSTSFAAAGTTSGAGAAAAAAVPGMGSVSFGGGGPQAGSTAGAPQGSVSFANATSGGNANAAAAAAAQGSISFAKAPGGDGVPQGSISFAGAGSQAPPGS
ncbi:unnamed protein product [Amoebophrya sp. A120]|nr:unnamed protein product [Amoebophrya sp. A120]|eukprot:GSA120T00000777001.1